MVVASVLKTTVRCCSWCCDASLSLLVWCSPNFFNCSLQPFKVCGRLCCLCTFSCCVCRLIFFDTAFRLFSSDLLCLTVLMEHVDNHQNWSKIRPGIFHFAHNEYRICEHLKLNVCLLSETFNHIWAAWRQTVLCSTTTLALWLELPESQIVLTDCTVFIFFLFLFVVLLCVSVQRKRNE